MVDHTDEPSPVARPPWLAGHLFTLAVLTAIAALVSLLIQLNPPKPGASFPGSLDLRSAMITMLWIFFGGLAAVSTLLRAVRPHASRLTAALLYLIAAAGGAGLVALVNLIWPF